MISLNALAKGVHDALTYKLDTTTESRPRVRFYKGAQEVGRVAMTKDEWRALVTAIDAPTPTPTPTPTPAPSGEVLWKADMEEGSLADWFYPSTSASGNFGGGEYNSGNADATASQERARSGSWSAKLTVNGAGGTRLFRWQEARAHRTLTYSAWYFLPQVVTPTGPYAYWIINEFKSRTPDNAHNDPFWYVNAYKRADGTQGAKLSWGYQSRLEGPRQGETGWRNFGDVTLPVGRWFQIVCTLTQSKDFDGAIRVTVDGQELANLTNVRTGWPNSTYNTWGVEQHWAVTNYSDGLSPNPALLFVDDCQISR